MYGLEELYLKGLSIGYIKEGSFNWNGSKGEVTKVMAAQVKGTAVKNIPTSNGTMEPTFQMLQFKYANLQKVLGGRLVKQGGKVVGWAAPKKLVRLEGFVEVFTDSGMVMVFPSALIQGFITGSLVLTDTSTVDCSLGINQPVGGENPYYLLDAATYAPYDAATNTPPVLPIGDDDELPAGFTVTPITVPAFSKNGGTKAVAVTAPDPDWTCAVNGGADWFTLAKANGKVAVTAVANAGDAREGSFSVTSGDDTEIVTVSQAAGNV